MPGSLSIRNLDDALVRSLKHRAARHGRSAEAEVREILRHVLAAGTAQQTSMSLPRNCGP